MLKSLLLSVATSLLLVLSFNTNTAAEVAVPTEEKVLIAEKLEALQALLEVKNGLNESLKSHQAQLKSVISETEKNSLLEEIATIEKELQETDQNFEEMATDTDLASIKEKPEQSFSLKEEVIALIKPTLQEIKYLTEEVRYKAELREKIAKNTEKQKQVNHAITHLSELIRYAGDNKALTKILKNRIGFWEKQASLITSKQTSAAQQLKKLTEAEVPLAESAQNYLSHFFKQRGFYILQALLTMIIIFFLSQLIRSFIEIAIPAFNNRSRSFRLRLLDLFQRVLTIILIVMCPVIIFYRAEDWVLFSFSLLILLGIAWSLKSVIPVYWAQLQIFLNIGSVREGERILLDGIPWRVEAINIFSILENPTAGIKQRVPIRELVNLKSRTYHPDEPWFPCAKGDWVILSDGVRGKVIGISCEFVKLVQRGGPQKTYRTSDFLSCSPLNLSVNFRIKETIGISYDLQAISTTTVLDILHETITRRAAEEDYTQDMLNLRVEFEYANTSSLDIVVIADFKGHLADRYNRLRRAIQRWCVDACTENDWEIPFTQVTLHSGGTPELQNSGAALPLQRVRIPPGGTY